MKVINDRTRATVTCPHCKSTLEVTSADVRNVTIPGLTNWCSDRHGWAFTCGACHQPATVEATGSLNAPANTHAGHGW